MYAHYGPPPPATVAPSPTHYALGHGNPSGSHPSDQPPNRGPVAFHSSGRTGSRSIVGLASDSTVGPGITVMHPAGVSDAWVEKFLRACGTLEKWKPTKDPSTGQSKNFGFADLSDLDTVRLVLVLLPRLQLIDTLSRVAHPLMVKLSRQLSQDLATFSELHPLLPADEERVFQSLRVLESDYNQSVLLMGSSGFGIKSTSDSGRHVADLNEAISFLASVLPESRHATLEPTEPEAPEKKNSIAGVTEKKTFVRSSSSRSDKVSSGDLQGVQMDDDQELKRRTEKHERELDRLYHDKLKKYQSRELHRVRDHEARQKFMLAHGQEERKRYSEKLLQFLASYDDDSEERSSRDSWFSDRDHWIRQRRPVRQKEAEGDERDRRRHQEGSDLRTPNDPANFNANQFKERLRQRLNTDLEFLGHFSGPDARDRMFAYPIQWAMLNTKVAQNKVKPLVDTRIENFLGAPESELADFIMETLLPSSTVQLEDGRHVYDSASVTRSFNEILAEIQDAFGDGEVERQEAQTLIGEVWRCIIWETEKLRALGDVSETCLGLEKPLSDLELEEIL